MPLEAPQVKRTDLIFFCSPNNPTGAAATRQQLEVRRPASRRRCGTAGSARMLLCTNDTLNMHLMWRLQGAAGFLSIAAGAAKRSGADMLHV